jgi:hypothetical protein
MAHNAADEKKVKDAAKKQKNERDQQLEDIKDILARPAGLRFFRRMFDDASIFSTTFTGNSHTFFREGARNLALMYFNDVCEASPERVAELMIRKKDIEKTTEPEE